MKAKEDFLGGNSIETNTSAGITPNAFRAERNGIKTPWISFEESETALTTPTVNVDELHLTEHSTEWTVYLGTEVTPEEQLNALWQEIMVKQVVKSGGTRDDGTRMTDGAQKYYDKTDTADAAAPETGYSALPISRYFTAADFKSLLNQLKSADSAEKTITYAGYGHNPGTITVRLEKTIVQGAQDAAGKTPGAHVTDIAVSEAETYTITVTYLPQTAKVSAIGRVTTGTGGDAVTSENEHVVNVFAKKLELLKVDQSGEKITSDSATFVLYRRATEADSAAERTTLSGVTGEFVAVQTLTTSNAAVST